MSVNDRISALTPEQRALFERLRAGQAKPTAPKVHQPPPIPRRSPPDGAGDWPLSYDQERMWALYYLDPQGTAYNIDTATRIRGAFEVGVFRRAMAEIVRRHAAWRTVFALVDGAPVQRVLPTLEIPLPLIDLTALPAARRDPEMLAIQAVDGSTPFDLERGPLVRTALLRLAPREHVFLVTVHHIVTDWVTFQLFWRELAAHCAAFSQGQPSLLPEPPVCYSDFAIWQREWMSGEVLAGLLAWWRAQLADMPLALDLPTDRPRPPINRMRGGQVPVVSGPGLAEALHAMARREGMTSFMTVLALVKVLFHLFSGQEKILLGSNNANRNRPEIEGVLGCFLTQIVFATDLSGDPTFRELLGRVRRVALGAYSHQDLPFLKLIEELQPERDASRQPLVQSLVLLLDGSHVEHQMAEGSFEGLHVFDGNSRYDVMFGLWDQPDSIFGAMEYNSDLFDASTALRLSGAFLRLMAAAVADPGVRLSQLPFLSAAERHQLLAEWSAGASLPAVPPTATVLDRFAARVAAAPHAPALLFAGEVVTFGELDRSSSLLARHLRGRGVQRDMRVALLLDRSPDLVAALFAVWKAGGAAVMLDPSLPAERLAILLADAEPAVVLKANDLTDPTDPTDLSEPVPSIRAQDPAYLIYTSGTTGTPKAVLVEHGSLLHTLDALGDLFAFGPDDRMPCLARFSFDIALFELLAPLLAGGACEIVGAEEVLEPRLLWAALERASRVHAVPSLMLEIVRQARQHAQPALPGLRTLFTGGDRVPPDLLADLLEVFPGVEVAVLYGPTEAAIVCSAWPVARGECLERSERALLGRPLPGVSLLILDRHGRLAPLGMPGELCIAGPGVARGYFRRDELTAERFFTRDGLRWYRTGDLVRRLADGTLEFLGRTDDQVKIRGFRVEPGEIAAVLATHPGVRDAVVTAGPDGRGETRLVAYCVSAEGFQGDLGAAVHEHLMARLPAYMLPSLVFLPALPLTAHGKIDKSRLPAPPEPHAAAFEPPRTAAEEMVAEIWRDVLGQQQVGRGDDFFALGGHSLLATRVMIRLREKTGIELPVRLVFQAPILAEMAAALAAQQAAGAPAPVAPPLRPLSRDGGDGRDGSPLPVSFAQERLWFLDRLAPGSPAYNLPLALRIDGPLDTGALSRALADLVARHESLRTTFPERAGRPVSEICGMAWSGETGGELPVIDLAPFAAGAEAEARRLAAAEAVRPFDLARGPLLRTALLRLGRRLGREDRHILLLTIHHIVSDAWSMGVLVGDLTALYAGNELPPLAVQYADYAAWQRAWLVGAELDRQLAFWRRHLAGATAVLDLPTDRPRPPVQSLRGSRVPVTLSAELSAALAETARAAGATLYMVLLAAWSALLARLSGQDDLVVGTAVANRDRPELERLIGFFVNTLALRADLSGDPAFSTLLERARQTVLDAFAHRDLPFEKLVEELHPARDRSRQPIFQVMLTFQNVPPGAVEIPGLTLVPLEIDGETAKFDLTLSLSVEDGRIQGSLEYAADLFERATAERLVAWLRTLLDHVSVSNVAAGSAARLSELPLLSPAERRQVLTAWNQTAAEFPREATIHDLFAGQAARTPEAVAVVCGEASLPYGELARRAGRLARGLRALGVTPEERIGLCAGRSLDLIAAFLGILAAGGAYLPLDPSYPAERLRFMLADAGAKVLLAERRLLAGLPPELERSGMRVLCLESFLEDLTAAGDPPAVLPRVPAESLAYVMYTSGSTGTPKGVAVTHRNVVRLVRGADYAAMGPGETWMQFAPVSFDVATLEIWAPLLNGGRLVLVPGERASLADLAAAIERHGVTSAWLTSGLFQQMVDHQVEGLRPLRQLLAGGDAVSPAHARRVLEALPGLTLIDGYGPTEGTTFSCCHAMTATTDLLHNGTSVPIGRPIANARGYVLDTAQQPVPRGVAGELCIGGEGLARGYLGRPELTAERFVPDPFAAETGVPGERLYRTGDRVRWMSRTGGAADEVLEFLGRMSADDGQVKIRGFRVEIGEIEAVLGEHPGVRQAAVLVRSDSAGSGRGKELVACVVPAAAVQPPGGGELQSFLRQRLPDPMVPPVWTFVDALPLTPNGKLDRRALAMLAGGVHPERAEPVAPRTPLEEQLVGACAEVLGLDPRRVGVLDNFFDLGGHSLLATQLIAQLRQQWSLDVPLQLLFDADHLADLALRITEQELAGADVELLGEMMAELEERAS